MSKPESLPVPPAKEVRSRLSIAVREVGILRRLLKLAEEAEREIPESVATAEGSK